VTSQEFALRVCIAALCGVLLGYERAHHHKNTGMRTLGLVGLGAGLPVAALQQVGAGLDDVGRVIQGLLAGIGFLGAGVILHSRGDDRPHGLTTAATVWLTSILGGPRRRDRLALRPSGLRRLTHAPAPSAQPFTAGASPNRLVEVWL
jgi:putative Mg2+ transporter-C (MgtC) family protein